MKPAGRKLCFNCTTANVLKEYIENQGSTGKCSLCSGIKHPVVDTASDGFATIIKCLIRYHYSEEDYHGSLGGSSLDVLLRKENKIFVFNDVLSEEDIEDFLLSFLDPLDYMGDICLLSAYGRAVYEHFPMIAVSKGKSGYIEQIHNELVRHNYYLVEDRYASFFERMAKTVEEKFGHGRQYYRARTGARLRAEDFYGFTGKRASFYSPHEGSDIGAPPVGSTASGRVNRPGVSYLYLATDPETAVAEVRPHPGEHVSTGKFKLVKNLKIADFSKHELSSDLLSESGLSLLENIVAIEKTFSQAVLPSGKEQYNITQMITEMFRKLGFDGLSFKSSVGEGRNLVVFNPAHCKWVEGSGNVHKIDSVEYHHHTEKLYDPSDIYDWTHDEMK